jgi:hypothetical protein
MSEKEEVLRQISEIKSHLVDKEAFFPYNFNACHVWSVISVLLTLVMIPSYEYSIFAGTIMTSLVVAIGFIVEGILTKQVNESYDIEECTRRQQFIMKNFIMIALFAIVFSTVFASYKLYIPIFILWLFLISLGHFAVGFVLNIKEYEKVALFNVFMAILLSVIALYFNLLENSGAFLALVQIVVIFGLAVLPSMVAYKQKKLEKQREGCSV